MLVFLSSLVGLLSSILPIAIKYLYLFKVQKYQTDNIEAKLSVIHKLLKSDNRNYVTKILSQKPSDTNHEDMIYGRINNIIRPAMAILFCSIYVYIKYLCWITLSETSAYNICSKLWTNDDAVIFSMIISFYFGSKATSKY